MAPLYHRINKLSHSVYTLLNKISLSKQIFLLMRRSPPIKKICLCFRILLGTDTQFCCFFLHKPFTFILDNGLSKTYRFSFCLLRFHCFSLRILFLALLPLIGAIFISILMKNTPQIQLKSHTTPDQNMNSSHIVFCAVIG